MKPKNNVNSVVIDCNYTFEQATAGTNAPQHIIDQLELITVHYYSMDGKTHQGQLLTNKAIVADLRVVFKEMLQYRFPVAQVIPIVKYNWSDDVS
ncbi:MAG: M15 family peptidase, partial [Paludibacter sp.]